MATLLRVATEFVSVEIQGRPGPPAALAALGALPRVAHLRVESSDGAYNAAVMDGEPLDPATNPPALFEESLYWLVVESRVSGSGPVIVQRDPSLITGRNEMAGGGVVALTVVYRGQVGRSEWRFQVGGQELAIEVEVFPAKLDYDLDYDALVDDVADVKRALVLEYFRGTHRVGGIDKARSGEPLEWITLLRQLILQLANALQQVNRAPHRALRYERQPTPLHQIRGATPAVVGAIMRRDGVGELVALPRVGKVHARLPVARPVDSLDTFEHRWLRSRLKFVHVRLLSLLIEQDLRLARASGRGGSSPTRLLAERAEIADMAASTEQLLALPVLEVAATEVPAAYSSLQLQTAIGYGQAYRILTALSAALSLAEDTERYSLTDLHELYEAWCFLKVVQIAAEVTGAEIDLSTVISTTSHGLRFNLVKGFQSRVLLRLGTGSVSLVYNEEYRMPTGIQRPDIVIHVHWPDHSGAVLVLDAKYRLDASVGYVTQFGSPGVPTDAVNDLHRYRDAIRPVVNGIRTPVVVSCVALFPWQAPLGPDEYVLRRALDDVGIGAIPFLPGNDRGVASWLSEMLEIAPSSAS